MNKILLIITIILFRTNLMAQYVTVENVYEKVVIYPKIITSDMIFKNNPKEVKSENYYYVEDEKKYEGYTIWKFNKNRQLIEFTSLLNNTYQKKVYIYDRKLLVKVIESNLENNNSITHYQYNNKNAIEKMEILNSQGDIIRMDKYFYNKTDLLFPYKIEKYGSIFSLNGFEKTTLKNHITIDYDSNHQITKIIKYNENEKFESALLFMYKSNFMIQEGISLNKELNLRTNYIYNRDKNNRIIERFEIDGGIIRLDYKNSYKDHLLIKREYYQNNEISAVELFNFNQYSDHISLSKENFISSTKNITSYKIDYDNKHNPIKKTKKINNALNYLNNYKYEYY